jgi:hypothetical protein
VVFLYATAGSLVMLMYMVIEIIKIKFMEEWRLWDIVYTADVS